MASSNSSGERGLSTGDLDAPIQNTEFFRSLVENGSDAIISIDENSTILYANRSVKRVFGYEPEELVGEKLTVLMPDRFQNEHFSAVEAYLETGERSLDWNNIELPAQHSDGHEVPLSITFEEHSYEGERIFSGIMRDITERVEYEQSLQRQNERLEEFASIVSHDLRNPLQTARATLAVAKAGDEAALEELDTIFDRMDELIEDVLSLAKQGQTVGETEPVELESAVQEAWSIAGTDEASLQTEDRLPTVSTDPERLKTLFENLIRNAIEHAGPAVTIRVGGLGETGFYLEDDGPGFEDADPERLFEHGYSTDTTNTGLGLSIVDDIVHAHSWTIEATTGAAGGARFEVETQ
ncbi:PAS domain S-box-containing protein [Halovenus aranensis]|jgi:PAS domain S-box-containing protein|uniref:histidine kinase n=1 Tax=Halovenus aranensis TaxID=890420 RepID=A0A1G8T338_9EURY|nr:PAS domain S-box protein [Halovenus aranensis]SDJ36049.1 PAS domain S-box-containing protein [Halovenus aranensis]